VTDGELRVAVVGFGWMGQVHSRAWGRLGQHYPDLPVRPRLVAVADTDAARRDVAQQVYGFEHVTDSWQQLLELEDVDVVSVCGPNFVHREIGEAVARSGRHLWIEKPAGRSAEDARRIAGRKSAEIERLLGFRGRDEMVHRDDLVVE